MDVVKVLEVLNNHILNLESQLQFKDWEIERLKDSLKKEGEHD